VSLEGVKKCQVLLLDQTIARIIIKVKSKETVGPTDGDFFSQCHGL
jgi:hypothetical protein